MAETDEIELKELETPEVVVEEEPKKAISADDGIEGLKKQLAAEKSRREELERRARAAETEVYKAKTEVDETNLQLIANAIETIKGQALSLKTAYAQAMASGDYNKAADIQLDMANSQAKLLQLENGRQAMAERPKAPPPVVDAAESMVNTLRQRGWHRSAEWLSAHPEYASGKLYQKMVAAHQMSEADDIRPDTDEYFAYIERQLGLKKAPDPVDDQEDIDGTEYAAKPMRSASPPAAPVSRSAPSSEGRRGPVRLSAAEREIAELNHMTPEQYYKRKQEIARETQRYN